MSDWQVDFIKQGALPKLAWLAEVATDARVVVVHHGGAVETRPHWFVEGTWDGRFEAGDFHRAENLFGSGMRVDGSTLTFCASVALVDRLFHVAWNDRLLVSNSLIQLLARTGARLDPRHNYRKESFASGYGIKQYPRAFKVLHPEIREIFQDLSLQPGRGGGPDRAATAFATQTVRIFRGVLRRFAERAGENQRQLPECRPAAPGLGICDHFDWL